MSVKFITSIYSDLHGTEYGGRVGRGGHYRYSLLSLLKMSDADFLCYTSDREIDSLKTFFYDENNISNEKLKFMVFDISNTKFKDLINQYKNIEETKKSDRHRVGAALVAIERNADKAKVVVAESRLAQSYLPAPPEADVAFAMARDRKSVV